MMMRAVTQILSDVIFPAICLVGIGYNVLVMLNAPEGIRMNKLLEERLASEVASLEALKSERDRLSDRADRLMSASLDKDFLDERVRSVLGLVRPGELMVRMDDLDRLAVLNNEDVGGLASSTTTDPIVLAMLGVAQ
ncbi:MAG: septum formation initiator family protein [Pseudomonadota bacterium]